MITNIEQIIDWFKQELKPNEGQFRSTWLSFWHKDEKIPVSIVENLSTILNSKADKVQLNGHISDPEAHAELFGAKADVDELLKYIPLGGNSVENPITGDLEFIKEFVTPATEEDEQYSESGYGKLFISKNLKELSLGSETVWNGEDIYKLLTYLGFFQRHYDPEIDQHVSASFVMAGQEMLLGSDDPKYRGIGAYEYYGANYLPNNFVQKRYVDEKSTALETKLSGFTTQEILSGGNYNNLEVTADLLVFKNENAQAILNGVWGKKDFHILNLSNTYEVKINHNSASVTGNGQPIKLPTATGNMGIKGTARILQTAGYGYFVADTWGSLYRPEYKGLAKKVVQTVDEFSNAGSMETTEFMVFRDAQTERMSKSELNTAYPDAKRPFQVVCNQLNLIYMKTDDNGNTWKSINLTSVT